MAWFRFQSDSGLQAAYTEADKRLGHGIQVEANPPESPRRYAPQMSCRCAILCLERALESEMDSMNGQHGK